MFLCNSTKMYGFLGFVQRIDAMSIAVVTHKLGGGRNRPGESVNWAVGIQLLVAVGDKVKKGKFICRFNLTSV